MSSFLIRYGYVPITLLSLILWLSPVAGRIIDPSSPADALLDSLAGQLDVRRGSALQAPGSPELTRLGNFPTNTTVDVGTYEFERFFRAGAFTNSVLLAVGQAPQPIPLESQAFRQLWDAAPKEQRVFVSFSGLDIDYARQVRAALQAQGYATFLYRSDAGQLGFNSVEVGRFFAESGTHLVIDSGNSRRSRAVQAEALAYRVLAQGGGRQFTAPRPATNPPTTTSHLLLLAAHVVSFVDIEGVF